MSLRLERIVFTLSFCMLFIVGCGGSSGSDGSDTFSFKPNKSTKYSSMTGSPPASPKPAGGFGTNRKGVTFHDSTIEMVLPNPPSPPPRR